MLRLLLDPQHDVLEGQAGIGLRKFLGRDLEAGRGQKFGLDARGDDFGIDEHAVAIENDKVWLGHGDPEYGRVGASRDGLQAARHTPTAGRRKSADCRAAPSPIFTLIGNHNAQ